MCVTHLSAAFNLELDQPDPKVKAVLLALANHADPETGYCWPAVRTLARYTGYDPRTVQRGIKRAIELGLVEVDRQAGSYGCNLYRLAIVHPVAPRPAPTRGVTHRQGEGGTVSPPPCHPATRTVNEPSLKDASDARDADFQNWQPSADLREELERQYPQVDIDHQLLLFIARCLNGSGRPRYPETAFKAWMARLSELKHDPPAPRKRTSRGKKAEAEARWADPLFRIETWENGILLADRMGDTKRAIKLRELIKQTKEEHSLP